MSTGTIRQILLITDGRSNSGVSPIEAAKKAFSQGIVVNVIGVLHADQSELDPEFQEIEQIARAGGGVSQVVYKENLSQTVQAVTKQAMSQTLQGFVHQELKHIFGTERELVDIEPEKRGEVMEVVEDLGEACELDVFVLVDTSASMRDKLLTVKEALLDLSMNLDARSGRNHFAIYQFPYKRETIGVIHDWAERLAEVSVIFPKLVSSGMTPSGPAIMEAINQFNRLEVSEWIYDEPYREEG
ncbi:MAG TPA: VWA domain-containing protein [Pseudogracilibacillus sp.]|nr:VWA domain-containing protein [Pseudogracilibacillus sp.]